MRADDILLLGIGIQPPWQLVDQHLDTSTAPHELHLRVAADRGARFPCPECGAACPAHDFTEKLLAPSELLSAPLLYHGLGAKSALPGTRGAARRGALGAQGQRLHAALRAGGPGVGAGNARPRG